MLAMCGYEQFIDIINPQVLEDRTLREEEIEKKTKTKEKSNNKKKK